MSSAEAAKISVVTGSASGIGRAVAEKFAEAGDSLVLIDRDQERLAEVASDLASRFGTQVREILADVSDRANCRHAFEEAVKNGLPDRWINNAGILRLSEAVDTPDDLFDSVMNTNFRSVFLFSTLFASSLIKAKKTGSIVNISSIHAVLSEPNAAVYTAAKGAIEAASRTFASEWASSGIRVNCVRPGATYTELTTPIYSEEIKRAIYARVPMKRIANAREIAEAVFFLASESSSYCTGTTLDVDGGYVMDGSLPEAEYQ